MSHATSERDPAIPPPKNVIEVFEATARAAAGRPALSVRRDGKWQTISWEEYRTLVHRTARSLIALGVAPGEGISILSANSPEWFIAYLAAVAAGAIPAGIYTTSTPEQCHYVAAHSESSVAFVDSEEQLAKFRAIRADLPRLKQIVLMAPGLQSEGAISWNEFLSLADSVSDSLLDDRLARQRAEHLCTLIYTSGTTGPPKAVMISHQNLTWTAMASVDIMGLLPSDEILSYLPLSHIAEQLVSLHIPMHCGLHVFFAESMERVLDNLRDVRPTLFLGVPRVWEKFEAGIRAASAGSGRARKLLIRWARKTGLAAGYAEQRGARKPLLYPLVRELIFSKVREKLGLDRARLCVTSAAPIALDTLEFFLSLGIPIYEVYGMSECTGPTTFSVPSSYRTGKAGQVHPATEIRIAEDGEILIRGPHVFMGYYKDPEATHETLDSEGWIHSGDVGVLDEKGFVTITDRKKDLIITAGGKNISPQNIEKKLRAIPAVAQAVVIGDRRNYLVALLTLDAERVCDVAARIRSTARDVQSARSCELFMEYIKRHVDEINRTLAQAETIKRFALVPSDFSIAGGELTPTMKVRRQIVSEKYRQQIERLYGA